MNNTDTRITSLHVYMGEAAIQNTYIKVDSNDELYGFLFIGEVTLFFTSKEFINSLQNALTELKEKWLVEEQKEVPARA